MASNPFQFSHTFSFMIINLGIIYYITQSLTPSSSSLFPERSGADKVAPSTATPSPPTKPPSYIIPNESTGLPISLPPISKPPHPPLPKYLQNVQTYLPFMMHSGHHNQHLDAMYATAMAMALGITNLLAPYACGRTRYDVGFQHTRFLQMLITEVYDMEQVVAVHQALGIKVWYHTKRLVYTKKGPKCGADMAKRYYSLVPEGPNIVNVTVPGPLALKLTWDEWVNGFWDRHGKEVEEGIDKMRSTIGDNAPIAVMFIPKEHITWGLLSTGCIRGQGFCLLQPFPAELMMIAARSWIYSSTLQGYASDLKQKLGEPYGFYHLRAEGDNIWGNRDVMLNNLIELVNQYPTMNWYVASGIFNPIVFSQRVDDRTPEGVKPIILFAHRVQAFRRSRSWCKQLQPGTKCGQVMVGDEMNPKLMQVSVELRTCIDQLVGRAAYIAAGLSQSSMTSVLYGYRVLLYNNSRTILYTPNPPISLVDHVTFLPWYSETFWEVNKIRKDVYTKFGVIKHRLYDTDFYEPDLRPKSGG
eukprot:PhF_6_TR7031/c0_g1_i2/m.10537